MVPRGIERDWLALADGRATVTTLGGRRVPIRLMRSDGADAVHDRLARLLTAH